jgi:lipoprotein-anchoring transpeptidase ErfK/SrfK
VIPEKRRLPLMPRENNMRQGRVNVKARVFVSLEARRCIMRTEVLFAIGLAFGSLTLTTPVAAEYNPAVQDRYDEQGNLIDGPSYYRQRMNGAPSGVNMNPVPREEVEYHGPYGAGTIVVNTAERRLYLVQQGGRALKYGIGVGRPGFTWGGVHTVTNKAEWPDWTPPPQMRKRVPSLPAHMEGGPDNPLGARAMYLGSTFYRIHGTSEPWTIGQAVSSGCFRMTNDDVTDLYERVKVGTKVIVQNGG